MCQEYSTWGLKDPVRAQAPGVGIWASFSDFLRLQGSESEKINPCRPFSTMTFVPSAVLLDILCVLCGAANWLNLAGSAVRRKKPEIRTSRDPFVKNAALAAASSPKQCERGGGVESLAWG